MELYFDDIYHKMECRIYGREKQGLSTVIIGYDGKNLVSQPLQEPFVAGLEFMPLLSIPLEMKQTLISAFIAEGEKMKMRTEAESALMGKLEATKSHLEDMRELSKKLVDAIISK